MKFNFSLILFAAIAVIVISLTPPATAIKCKKDSDCPLDFKCAGTYPKYIRYNSFFYT